MDYLGAALNEWFDQDKRKNFVLKKSNLVIGFFSLTWYRNMVKFKWIIHFEAERLKTVKKFKF